MTSYLTIMVFTNLERFLNTQWMKATSKKCIHVRAKMKQISTSLPESFDPAHSRLLAKAACILLASNRLSPGDAIAEAQKVITLAGL